MKMNIRTEAYYQNIADNLENQSENICKDNHCTEDEHFCGSNAYFEKMDDDLYTLCTVCYPDYCKKVYNSYVSLPFSGNAFDLHAELVNNDITIN